MEPLESEHDKEKIERLRRAMYSREISEGLRARPRRKLDDVRPIVDEEWHHQEPELSPSIVAPRAAIAFTRKALWWVLGAAVIFFVLAIGFFIYYFSVGGGSSPASAGNIDILISGPPQIAGGEPTQLQIAVTNRNQVPLQLADLVISYPPGTRSPTDLVTDLSSQRISLGTIEAGGRRQGTVSAVFAGEGGVADVKVELEYRITGSSAIFIATSEYQASLNSSPITLSVEGKQEAISGQPVEFVATLASNANTTVKDVLLTSSYPFGFTYASSDPKPARVSPGGSGHVWELGSISPGQKRQVTLRGSLVGEMADQRVFRFSAGVRKDATEQTISTKLSQHDVTVKISEPFLGLSVAVNKSTGENVVVAPGATVNVVVNWQNNLSTSIQDAVIVARLSGIQIDGSTVISPDGFYRSSDGVIIWDKNTTKGALGSLIGGAHGTVSFSFRMPTSEELQHVVSPTLTFTINAAGKRISEQGVPENLQSAASERVVVSSDLRVTAQGLYYANPFTSVGPLPPKAGSETTYAIVFTLTNTTSKIEGAKLTATLPTYVRWVGIYSPASEDVTFNQNNSSVTWNIGPIEPGVGTNGALPRQAAIAVGLTPSTSQIGQEPALLQDITFTGTDSSTKQSVSRDVDDVTTNVIGDPGFSATQATVVR